MAGFVSFSEIKSRHKHYPDYIKRVFKFRCEFIVIFWWYRFLYCPERMSCLLQEDCLMTSVLPKFYR